MYECVWNDKETANSKLNPFECAIFNDFEVHSIHAKSAETEKWSIHITKVDNVEYNGKLLLQNRVKI